MIGGTLSESWKQQVSNRMIIKFNASVLAQFELLNIL